jgi:nitrous oxide reductase
MTTKQSLSRRQFLATSAAATVATAVAPGVITASKTDSQVIVGEGDYR